MSQEIERKFLLRAMPAGFDALEGKPIEQGYLAIEPHGNQVRLRKKGDVAFLAVKRGPGIVREEYEIELAQSQFETLWPLTAGRRLTKKRYETPHGGKTVEIDVYGGIHRGLVVAEVEFETVAEARDFAPPDWFGEEVSGRPEYTNLSLARE